MAVKQDGTRRCKDCGQIMNHMATVEQCNPCYKRLVWRPANGVAVDRDRAASRAVKARHRPPCEDCGVPVTWRSTSDQARWCHACFVANHQVDITRAAVERKWGERRDQIVQMWHDGLQLKEIAASLGTTKESIGAQIHKLRTQGYDLPYRRRTYAGQVHVDGQPIRRVAA